MYNEVMDSIQITARAPRELIERLDRFAARTHRSRAGAIEWLLERGLDEEEAAQAGSREEDRR
jgi:predicted transcriptional regulator